MSYRRRTKYHSQKVVTSDGLFDSKHEARRWFTLKEQEAAGYISNLQRQVPFELIPSQKDEDGRTIERPVKYIADFVYADSDNRLVVEDAKGYKTPEYIIKRKMLLDKFGIRIKEV